VETIRKDLEGSDNDLYCPLIRAFPGEIEGNHEKTYQITGTYAEIRMRISRTTHLQVYVTN
jgi:hypothetical protein